MKQIISAMAVAVCLVASAYGAEYRVLVVNQPAPADELSSDIAAQLAPVGYQIVRGESRVYCEIWLCQQVAIKADFQPTNEILYPFQPGQLIGVIRFPRGGNDFRDQELDEGTYTMRYALQPVDGAHVGTSPTRDFLLLVRAQDDRSAASLDEQTLIERSAEAAQSTHPAMLCLQRPAGNGNGPALRHNEEHDWWIVTLPIKAKAGEQQRTMTIDLVVVGMAAE